MTIMKNLLIAFALLFSCSFVSAQEWGSVDKNKVTMREVAPVWPGCESKSQKDQCFKQMLATHIAKNYRYPAEAIKQKIQGRPVVEFYITEEGTVDIKSVSGAHPLLEEEAKRNILSIPKMAKPGMLAGKPKAIKYVVPITFKL